MLTLGQGQVSAPSEGIQVLLNEGRVEQEICSVLCDDVDAVPDSCGEERAECGIKVPDLRVNVCTYPHLWPRALGSD